MQCGYISGYNKPCESSRAFGISERQERSSGSPLLPDGRCHRFEFVDHATAAHKHQSPDKRETSVGLQQFCPISASTRWTRLVKMKGRTRSAFKGTRRLLGNNHRISTQDESVVLQARLRSCRSVLGIMKWDA